MVMTVLSLVALAFVVVVFLWAAALAGRLVYLWIRRRDARPLNDEEKWQETSSESMSEEEWASLIASMAPENRPTDDTDKEDGHRI
jgi:hypothetical protein